MAYVMIVDDDEDLAQAIAKVLTDAGHEVEIQVETRAALAKMSQKPPELVILDVMFPENSSAGFELARAMRHHHEKLKNTPILMLTAVNAKFPLGFSARDIDDEWLPVTDFVEKPAEFGVLLNKVSAMLPQRSSTVQGLPRAGATGKARKGEIATLHRILVVDDDDHFLCAVACMLREEGYVVDTALSADEARARLKSNTPDLILLDVLMPETDGFAFAEELAKDQALARIPIVLVTAVAENVGHMMQAFEKDLARTVSDILPKSEVPNRLLDAVAGALGEA